METMKRLHSWEGKRMATIKSFKSWEGTDVSNAISLFEYGFLYKRNQDKNKMNVVHFHHIEDDQQFFTYSSFYFDDWKNDDTFITNQFLAYSGCTLEEWHEMIDEECIYCIHDLVGYYGYENIFGSDYSNGFPVKE